MPDGAAPSCYTTRMADNERQKRGAEVRRAVMGDTYVDRSLATKFTLSEDLQELLNDFAWGSIWARPGLDRKQRSLMTIAILIATNHPQELRFHFEAARRNGLTSEQIMEAVLHCVVYCGFPATLDAVRIAREVLSLDESASP